MIYIQSQGTIVGSRIYAQNGISTSQLGNPAGNQVEVYCGIDYILQNKLKKLQKAQYSLSINENELKKELRTVRAETHRSEIIQKLKNVNAYKEKLMQTTIRHLDQMDQNEQAKLVVRDTIYPGVYLEICHVSHIVRRERTNCIFYLDKNTGRVECTKG